MILHQQTPPDSDTWLAVHCETLTLAHCEEQGDVIKVSQISPVLPGPAITSWQPADHHGQPVDLIAASIRRAGQRFEFVLVSSPPQHRSDIAEWLLLNSLDGSTPAVMHTSDPVFIAIADPATAILRAPEFYSSSVDLSVEGWKYWWEDAQSHFEKLAVQHALDVGMNVPAHIRRLV